MNSIYQGALHQAAISAAWNAIAPKRIAATREVPGATMVLHPTKGWRRISHKRLGIA
ncbi:hypothetical protein [Methylobacterium sp. D48H]